MFPVCRDEESVEMNLYREQGLELQRGDSARCSVQFQSFFCLSVHEQ